jgi:hypothetical protein
VNLAALLRRFVGGDEQAPPLAMSAQMSARIEPAFLRTVASASS